MNKKEKAEFARIIDREEALLNAMEEATVSGDIAACDEALRRIDEYAHQRMAKYNAARKTDVPSYVSWHDLNEVHMLFDRVYDLQEGSKEMAACREDIKAYKEAENDILVFTRAMASAAAKASSARLKGLLDEGKSLAGVRKALEEELSAIRKASPSAS